MSTAAIPTHSSERDDWETPGYILDAARYVLGGQIDLDPASSEAANEAVGAKTYYTASNPEGGALAHPWHASRLWLNPPYGRFSAKANNPQPRWASTISMAGVFAQHLLAQVKAHNVFSAVMLIRFVPDPWWEPIWDSEAHIALIKHRVQFIHAETRRVQKQSPQVAHALVYFDGCLEDPDVANANLYAFMHAVKGFGRVIR